MTPFDIDVNETAAPVTKEGRRSLFDDIAAALPPASAARIVAALQDTIEHLVGDDPEAVERAAQRLLEGLRPQQSTTNNEEG